MNIWAAGAEHLVQASREAGIDSRIQEATLACFRKAVDRGHGLHDLPALYEAFVRE